MSSAAKLIFLCGKMTAGTSELARHLAERVRTVLLVQDELLDSLFPGEIIDIPDFVSGDFLGVAEISSYTVRTGRLASYCGLDVATKRSSQRSTARRRASVRDKVTITHVFCDGECVG
jgi:hypothetical protein